MFILQVFAEITAGGKAKLVLKKLAAEDVAQMNAEEGDLEGQDGENRTPVRKGTLRIQ